jgi:hypothetical protein
VRRCIYIQSVSEFDRQTFRANSMIKNKHKTLNRYIWGQKPLVCEIINKTPKNNYDLKSLDFMGLSVH